MLMGSEKSSIIEVGAFWPSDTFEQGFHPTQSNVVF